jgi:HK97 family phage major capsid protein
MANSVESARQLLAERRDLVARLEGLANRELTPDEQAQWDALTAQVAQLDTRVSALEDFAQQDVAEEAKPDVPPADMQQDPQANSLKLADLEKRLTAALEKAEKAGVGRRTAPAFVRDMNDRQANKDRDLALRGWLLSSAGEAKDSHRAAADRIGFNFGQRSLNVPLSHKAPRSRKEAEARAQSVGTASAGGYLVPITLSDALEKQLLYYTPVREVAQVIRTATGNQYDIPTVNDTTNKGEIISENTTFNTQDVAFGKVTLNSFKYSSKIVLCSIEILQDSIVDVPSLLGDLLGERLGRIQADHFTTGTGSSQPQGIVTGAASGATAASATSIGVDDIITLAHSVDRAYRPQGQFMMSDNILAAVRKIKDSYGRPIFTESYIVGEPDRILGYPVFINNSMDTTVASTKKTILFGDFSKYVVRDALDVQILRLDERYAEYGQVAFTALQRSDGRVLMQPAIKYLVH